MGRGSEQGLIQGTGYEAQPQKSHPTHLSFAVPKRVGFVHPGSPSLASLHALVFNETQPCQCRDHLKTVITRHLKHCCVAEKPYRVLWVSCKPHGIKGPLSLNQNGVLYNSTLLLYSLLIKEQYIS
jgi:hypothetical protein